MEKIYLEDLSDEEIINTLSYDKQIVEKQNYLQKLWKNNEVMPLLSMDNPNNYRHKVVTTFGYNKRLKKIEAGMYKPRSHKIEDKKELAIIEELELQEVSNTIFQIMKKYKMMPYDEDTQVGFLRHILLRKSYYANEILVVLVVSSFVFNGKNNFIKELTKKHPNIKSIVLNENRRRTSIILGDKEKVIYGSGYINDSLCNKRFRISSKSFYQVNPVQTEVLYSTALNLLKLNGNEVLVDAYCGIGTIGIIASDKVKSVIGVESNKEAIKDAIHNSKVNGCDNVRLHCDDASNYLEQLAQQKEKVDVVIMDPPRSGSDERFLSAVCKLKPKKIAYISCGPETQVRDVKYLLKNGYKITTIQGLDMFPFTKHCETIVILKRFS